MLRTTAVFVLLPAAVFAEVHTLTLKQAVDLALRQNPDVLIARLDEQRARESVRVAKDPFVPKLYGGSGLAWTTGYPTSIEGSPPSIFEARTTMTLYNRPLKYELAAARENVRGAAIDVQQRSSDVAYRTASLYLDARQAAQTASSISREVENLQAVREAVNARVQEGRELPIENRRADLNLARARQRAEAAASDRDYAQEQLADVLGFPPGDRVVPGGDEGPPPVPESEKAAIDEALDNSREVKKIQSQLQARMLQLHGYEAARWPVVDLVAQYNLLAKHNYQDFFKTFQRNNGQLGVSVSVPVLVGSAAQGYVGQAAADIAKLRAQANEARNRITLDTAKAYNDMHTADAARDIARMDLDVAREQVTVLLAQLEEGRVPRQQVEQARTAEQEKWIALYNAENTVDKARLALLHQTGTIVAALR